MKDSTARLQLRLARTEPALGAPLEPARRRTFGAALQQFEELMDAAAGLSYLSRPLPLFYALSQAGRAIVAARIRGSWELQAHGLSFHQQKSFMPLQDRPIKLIPRADGADSFSQVGRVLGVRVSQHAELRFDDVCAAIPELSLFTHLPSRRALPVQYEPQGVPGFHFVSSPAVHAGVGFWARL